jgi:serine-type D-Ala-D-Ala carboxypeptidase (penicillin-binding protein 5/6)
MKYLTKKNNFLFLLMLSFVFIASSAMAMSGKDVVVNKFIHQTNGIIKNFPPNPVLAADTAYPVLSAQGVYAVDLDSGVTLYEKNADASLLPASTTKIVTALVALDTFSPDQIITVGKEVLVIGQKMHLYPGEQMKFIDLLNGLLVFSANDAAETIAYNYPAGYDAFIVAMNLKAKELSMTNSHFDNPIGLDGTSQQSTAKDLVRASEVAMRNPTFSNIVGTKEITLTDVSGKSVYKLKNINELLGNVPGVLGVKTGWTENARENLVTYVERDNHRVMLALLGSQDRFGETKELIDWIFGNYQWREVKLPE